MNLNLLAIIVAGVVYFVIGGLWYAVLFTKPFMRYRLKPGETIEPGKPTDYLITLVTDVISAATVAAAVALTGAVNVLDGIVVGLAAGIGLASTATLKYTIFNGPPKVLWVIDLGLILAGFAAMGAILAVWR